MEEKIKSRKRETFIDVAKGIGIYVIVLVHFTQGESLLRQYLLSFCVPFFFVVSGMLFSYKKEFPVFLKNIIQKMIVPLFAYGVIDAIFTVIWKFVTGDKDFGVVTIAKICAKIFFVSGGANSNGPLWYIPVLVLLQLIMYYPARSGKKWFPAVIGIIMLTAGYFVHFKGPFRVGQVPSAMVFFCVGMYSKAFIMKLKNSNKVLPVFLASALLFAVLCWYNGFSEMAAMNYGRNYIVYYLTALSATLALLTIAMLIDKNKVLEFYGTNSLTIMCTHYHLARYIIPWLLGLAHKENILNFIPVEIMFSLLVMLIMVLVIKLVNSKLPVLTGNYRIKILDKVL